VPDSAEAEATPEPVDPDALAARRVARLAVVAVAVLVVAVVIAVALRRGGDDEPSPLVGSTGSGGSGSSVDIGPLPGDVIADYLAARQAALGALADDDEREAVVSFTRYRTLPEADSVLAESGLDRALTVESRIVAAPGGAPTVVSGSLEEWASASRTQAEADRAAI
jgi:hypothetical protein